MKKARFTETRIVPILRQQEAGKSFRDISREHGIGDATFYNFDFKWPDGLTGTLVLLHHY